MTNADINAATMTNTTFNLQDYWSKGVGKPQLDTALGGKDDLTDKQYDSGTYTVTYNRLLDTGDKFDNIVEIVNKPYLSKLNYFREKTINSLLLGDYQQMTFPITGEEITSHHHSK